MRRRDGHDGQGRAAELGGKRGGGGGPVGRGETGVEASPSSPSSPSSLASPSSPSSPSLPVFLFPSELLFHSEQRHSHRRVLTLYNPYRFRISFKMLCTAPSLYRVVEAEGSVRAKSCVDLVVRHLDVSPRNWGRRDRFRLEVRGGGQVGEREIWAELRGGEEGGGGGGEGEEEEEEDRRRRSKRGGGQQRTQSALTPLSPLLVPTQTHLQTPTCTAVRSVSQWAVCVMVAVLCVTVLMLPHHTESSSLVPRCLHVSTNQKLACAYTLGLLTMVFLR